MMGKKSRLVHAQHPSSLKLRMKVMSSGASLVQETADCIDEVIQSQAP
jgi:hypothetical protein